MLPILFAQIVAMNQIQRINDNNDGSGGGDHGNNADQAHLHICMKQMKQR